MVGCCNYISKVKLKWTAGTTEMATELMHFTFYNSQLFMMEARTIPSNYSRLSICQISLFLEILL